MKVCDVVRLRSGGPAMTVDATDGKIASVIWFDELGGLQRARFQTGQLEALPAQLR